MAEPTTPLFSIRGDASPEEVAALVAVLQGLAAAGAAAYHDEQRPGSEWSAHRRKMRTAASPLLPAGPGGWRSSALPR